MLTMPPPPPSRARAPPPSTSGLTLRCEEKEAGLAAMVHMLLPIACTLGCVALYPLGALSATPLLVLVHGQPLFATEPVFSFVYRLSLDVTLGTLLNLWYPIRCTAESLSLLCVWLLCALTHMFVLIDGNARAVSACMAVGLGAARLALTFSMPPKATPALPMITNATVPSAAQDVAASAWVDDPHYYERAGWAVCVAALYLGLCLVDRYAVFGKPPRSAWVRYGALLVGAPCWLALGLSAVVLGVLLGLYNNIELRQWWRVQVATASEDETGSLGVPNASGAGGLSSASHFKGGPSNGGVGVDALDVHEAFLLARAQYLNHQNEKNA
jgi:hypothetical protein